MARKTSTTERSKRREAPKAGKPARKGGSRRMGEGVNFGKGQQRRVGGKQVTRKPAALLDEGIGDALGF